MIQNKQQRRESEEKKILIPLNEESSDDEALSLSSNEGGMNRKNKPLQDPKFIVTLDGINSSYFKSKDNPAPPPPVTGSMDLSAKSKTSTAPNAVQQHSGGGGNNGGAIIKPANVITNKPTASIAPMPKEIRPSLPKLSKQQSNQLEKQQKQIKTAAVAPKEDDKPKMRVRKKITGPKIDHEKQQQQQSSVE